MRFRLTDIFRETLPELVHVDDKFHAPQRL